MKPRKTQEHAIHVVSSHNVVSKIPNMWREIIKATFIWVSESTLPKRRTPPNLLESLKHVISTNTNQQAHVIGLHASEPSRPRKKRKVQQNKTPTWVLIFIHIGPLECTGPNGDYCCWIWCCRFLYHSDINNEGFTFLILGWHGYMRICIEYQLPNFTCGTKHGQKYI